MTGAVMNLTDARESFERIEKYRSLATTDVPSRTLVSMVRLAGHHAERVGQVAEELAELAMDDEDRAEDAAKAIVMSADAEREVVLLAQRVGFFLQGKEARRTNRKRPAMM